MRDVRPEDAAGCIYGYTIWNDLTATCNAANWRSASGPARPGTGTGTAAGGSGLELDRWLQEGDAVELEIEGIGVLRNTIGPKEK